MGLARWSRSSYMSPIHHVLVMVRMPEKSITLWSVGQGQTAVGARAAVGAQTKI